MSKLIKSADYIQAHPCRLEPIDVDAFFINNSVDESEGKNVEAENSMEMRTGSMEYKENEAEVGEEIFETGQADVLKNPEDILKEASVEENMEKRASTAPQSFDLKHLANFAEQIGVLIDGAKPKTENTSGIEKDEDGARERAPYKGPSFSGTKKETNTVLANLKEVAAGNKHVKKQETESFLSKLKKVAAELVEETKPESSPVSSKSEPILNKFDKEATREAEKIFFEAKKRALGMTEGAKVEADNQNKVWELTEDAKKQANSILEGANLKASEITMGANRQADKIIEEAKQQAALIIEGARQQGDKLIQRSSEQADEIIENARQQKEELMKGAREEAEKLLASAREQSVSIKEQARTEGLQAGRREGAAQIRREMEKNLATALSLVSQAEQERANRIAESESELLKLAVYIAEKIIGEEIRLDATRQIDIIKEALSRVSTATSIIIRLCPDDYQLVSENEALLQEVFSEPKPVSFKEDSGINKGSCFIETDHGNVDARIKSQLELIMTELLKAGQIK